MKDKAYKLGLTVPQYVEIRRNFYRKKHRAEILGIIFFSMTAAACVVAIAYGIILSLT
jgi:hypothetical protein